MYTLEIFANMCIFFESHVSVHSSLPPDVVYPVLVQSEAVSAIWSVQQQLDVGTNATRRKVYVCYTTVGQDGSKGFQVNAHCNLQTCVVAMTSRCWWQHGDIWAHWELMARLGMCGRD